MTKINIQADCGNSPRKEFLKELNIAFAKGNADFIIEHASDDIVWTIYGDKKIEGKEFGNYILATTAETDAKPGTPAGAINGGFFL